jgi:predicted acylesterase/phospholipase RssA
MTFFAETRHSYGHTALMLSGGATFGKFHFGVIKALHEHDLFPRTVCGASVGSAIAAAICSKPYEELERLFDPEFVFKLPLLGYLTNNIWETI